jgi:hypothetical protein
MKIVIGTDTSTEALVNATFTDEQGDTFTILTADHAPNLGAVAYGARASDTGRLLGNLFVALLPYGKKLIMHTDTVLL